MIELDDATLNEIGVIAIEYLPNAYVTSDPSLKSTTSVLMEVAMAGHELAIEHAAARGVHVHKSDSMEAKWLLEQKIGSLAYRYSRQARIYAGESNSKGLLNVLRRVMTEGYRLTIRDTADNNK